MQRKLHQPFEILDKREIEYESDFSNILNQPEKSVNAHLRDKMTDSKFLADEESLDSPIKRDESPD